MKKMYLFMLLAIGLLVACDDDEDNVITLSLENPTYILKADTPLEIVLNASENMGGLTAVPFRLSGSAVEDEDYTISDKEFVFLPATRSARIRITPKENYAKDRDIILSLNPVNGFELQGHTTATVAVEARKSVICNFTRATTDLYTSRVIKLKVTDDEGNPWSAAGDLHIPFKIEGTAEAGTHYTIENNVSEFVIPAGKDEATITLNYQNAVENYDLIQLSVIENSGVHTSTTGTITVRIVQPNILSDMIGTWTYANQFISLDLFGWWVSYPEDLVHLPDNESSAGTLRFISEESDSLAINLTGDLAEYFRSTSVSFLKEVPEMLMEQDWLDATITYATLGKANVNFSAAHTSERPVMIGFRFPDDSKNILEVRIIDYEPTDFLTASYQDMLNSLSGDDLLYPMKDFYPLVFNFRRE